MTAKHLVRPAEPEDATALAEVWLRSFSEATLAARRGHPDDEVGACVRDVLVPLGTVSVVEADTAVVACSCSPTAGSSSL